MEASPNVPTDAPVRFTESAIAQVQTALAEENANREKQGAESATGLRVGVVGGGCAGFQYALDFEAAPRPGDAEFEVGGFRVFVDRFSIGYLAGCEIDWATTPMGSGFRFQNPNVTTTCGCGSSFA